jgi:hypothetical protein
MENNKETETLRRGRPAKEKDKLNHSINLKLTAKDFNMIKDKAAKLGMKATRYAREMVLKGSVKSRYTLEELDLMRKLGGEANNLNQLAKKANQSGFTNVAIEVVCLATRIKKLLNDS